MQRQHVVAFHPWKRRLDETVVADVAAQVLLDDDDGEDQLAQWNPLVEPPASPVAEFGAGLVRLRVADPVAEVMQELEDTLLEVNPSNRVEPAGPFVDQQVVNDVRGESRGVDFDQFDEFCRNHGESPSVSRQPLCSK